MGETRASEILVCRIGMGIEMNEAKRRLPAQGAEDAERDQMIPAGDERHRALRGEGVGEGAHQIEACRDVERIDRCIAAIGHPGQFIGADGEHRVMMAHQGRGLAQGARAETRPGAEGRSAIERNAENRYLRDRIPLPPQGKPHEGGKPRETGTHHPRRRTERIAALRHEAPFPAQAATGPG